MNRFAAIVKRVVFSALLLAVLVFALVFLSKLPWVVGWDLWTALTAVGTIGATAIAIILSLRAWLQERDSTARVVTAWITDAYEPRSNGSSYARTVRVHLANEANEPVFNAIPNVQIGGDQISLGPLSVPSPLSVIPPRRELVFDVSIPLLAHTDSWRPTVTLRFTDPKGRRWHRLADGELRNVSKNKSRWSKGNPTMDERQLGDYSVLNPMLRAIAFLHAVRETNASTESMAPLLANGASGWADMDWADLRNELENYQPTSMVNYPAPRIARIKLSGDPSLEGRQVQGDGLGLELTDYKFMTLTLEPQRGWCIFGVGGSLPPDAINFNGSLLTEIHSYSDETAN